MKTKTLGNLLFIFWFLAIVFGVLIFTDANATKKKDPPPNQEQEQSQHQGQQQRQDQWQNANANSESQSASDSNANNEGNSLSVESNYESGPAEVVLVPHNNTANCQRVYGLGGGNTSGNIVLGVPFRDRTCDLEAAADDAFAQGNTALGWVFKCKQKNIKREFGGKDWKRDGEKKCLSMVNSIDHLNNRIAILEDQKETLLIERKHDQRVCKEATKRAHETCVTK